MSKNGRYVTADPNYWCGRLSMAVALSIHRPDPRAAEALEHFLESGKPSTELRRMLRAELAEAKK
jgi:hypothetical protein